MQFRQQLRVLARPVQYCHKKSPALPFAGAAGEGQELWRRQALKPGSVGRGHSKGEPQADVHPRADPTAQVLQPVSPRGVPSLSWGSTQARGGSKGPLQHPVMELRRGLASCTRLAVRRGQLGLAEGGRGPCYRPRCTGDSPRPSNRPCGRPSGEQNVDSTKKFKNHCMQ